MSGISVEQLAQWRASGKNFVLLDVREPFEVQVSSLTEALHIPMRQIPLRFQELDPGADIAVLCHYGERSEYVARFLRAQGFTSVHNVAGGIDAYAKRIDATVPRY